MNESKLIRSLFVIAAMLLLANIINLFTAKYCWNFDRLFSFRLESNFSTWFSSMLLAIASYFAYSCSVASKTYQNGKRMWQFLAVCLIFMSLDETAMIHESIGLLLRKYAFRPGSVNSAWVIVSGPIVLFTIIIFTFKLKKYLKFSKKVRDMLLTGALLYLSGAFVLEATINFMPHSEPRWLWASEYIIEEACEILGVIFIIKGLMEQRKLLLKAAK